MNYKKMMEPFLEKKARRSVKDRIIEYSKDPSVYEQLMKDEREFRAKMRSMKADLDNLAKLGGPLSQKMTTSPAPVKH